MVILTMEFPKMEPFHLRVVAFAFVENADPEICATKIPRQDEW
jgi:hypothetical protein